MPISPLSYHGALCIARLFFALFDITQNPSLHGGSRACSVEPRRRPSGSANQMERHMADKDKGKGKPYLSVVRDTDRLTAKQEAFAQQVAEGAILSDAYRDCYSADNMADRTVWTEACRLASNPKVATRIKAIQTERESDQRMIRLRREEYVLKRLQQEAEQAETDGARVRSLELLGRTISMFSDRVEIEQDESKSAAELERDLEKRLRDLLGE